MALTGCAAAPTDERQGSTPDRPRANHRQLRELVDVTMPALLDEPGAGR
jgi:hypothetical protein